MASSGHSTTGKASRSSFACASGWTLVLGLMLTAVVFRWAWLDATKEDLRRFETMAKGWRQEFETRAEKYEHALETLADWISSDETPSLREWENRLHRMNLRVNYPGMLLLTYSPWFSPHTLNHSHWRENHPAHWLPPAQWKSYELPVWYQEVQHPALPYPFGHSMAADLAREVDLDGTRIHELKYIFHFKGVGSTGKLMVPVGDGSQHFAGFQFFSPCYRKDLPRAVAFDEPPLSEEELGGYPVERGAQHQHAALGILVGTICFDPFLESIFGGRQQEIDVDLYAREVQETNRLTRLGLPALKQEQGRLYLQLELPWYHQRWHIVAVPNRLFYKNSHLTRAWAMGSLMAVITLAAFALLRVQENARIRAELWASGLEEAREELRAVLGSRNQLERDLHDGVLQSLYSSILGIQRAARLVERRPDQVGPILLGVASEMDAAMTDIRRHLTCRVSEGIPAALLPEMLLGLASAYNRTGETKVQLSLDSFAVSQLTNDQSEQVFNCVREAVTNAQKHGLASLICIQIRCQNQRIEVAVDDDGRGFDSMGSNSTGRGISHMTQRAELCGGTFAISSRFGGPTSILISIPISGSRA